MPNYVPSILKKGARVFLVGEAPGADEDRLCTPFVGKAGRLLNQLLEQAGINRAEVSIANVARNKPPGNKINFFYEDSKCTTPKPIMHKWIGELKEEIISVNPNIVVALGATAMHTLLGQKGMIENRGYIQQSTLVPGKKVLVTWHPQKVGYEWKLGFETIMDLRKALASSKTPSMPADDRQLNSCPSTAEFLDYMKFLLYSHKDPIALDLEVAPGGSHIDIVGLADSPKHALSYNLLNGNRTPRLEPAKEAEMWYLLAKVLKEKEVIAQNGMYDIGVLWHHLNILAPKYKYDIMVAAHVVWPEVRRSLGFLSSLCLDVPKWKDTSQSAPTMYNASDAANTYGVWQYMEQELHKTESFHTFEFEMMQVWPAVMMQLQGLEVNTEVQKHLIMSIKQRLLELQTEIHTETGNSNLNIGSPQQLQKLLYIDMKLPMQYKRRKSRFDERKVTTESAALKKLYRDTRNELLAKILEWKKLNKLVGFVDISLSPDNRVHTSYNITGATMARSTKRGLVDDEGAYKSFGRWSSSKSIILPFGSGNLQNIPKKARKMYTAPAGKVFLQADYMQAEAVVVAYCIGDYAMIELFKESFGLSREERKDRNLDIHKLTASIMFRTPIQDVMPEQRSIGKMIRHATNYSAGPMVLANGIGCALKEAKALLEQFHNTTPQLRLWHQSIQKELYQTRTLTNLLGRKHRFLERWGDELFRSAYSFIPQSTVGDLLNTALLRLYNHYGDQYDIVLQLHDAIYILVEQDRVPQAMEDMRKSMLMPLYYKGQEFTIDVDFSVGQSWGELEEI